MFQRQGHLFRSPWRKTDRWIEIRNNLIRDKRKSYHPGEILSTPLFVHNSSIKTTSSLPERKTRGINNRQKERDRAGHSWREWAETVTNPAGVNESIRINVSRLAVPANNETVAGKRDEAKQQREKRKGTDTEVVTKESPRTRPRSPH